jgi:hypothetical protein
MGRAWVLELAQLPSPSPCGRGLGGGGGGEQARNAAFLNSWRPLPPPPSRKGRGRRYAC